MCRGTCGRSLPATSDYFTVERYRKTDGKPIFATLCRDCRRAKRSKQYHDNIEVERDRNRRRYNEVEAYDEEKRKSKTEVMRRLRERDRIKRAEGIVEIVVRCYVETVSGNVPTEDYEEFKSKLLGGCRKPDVVEARYVAIYVIRNHCPGLTWAKIAPIIGSERTSASRGYKLILREVERRNGRARNKVLRQTVDLVIERYLERFVPDAKRLRKPIIKKHRVVLRSTPMAA